MHCPTCDHADNQEWDLEPAVYPADRIHSLYDPTHDAIAICPACRDAEFAVMDAADRKYAAQIEYACGVRD